MGRLQFLSDNFSIIVVVVNTSRGQLGDHTYVHFSIGLSKFHDLTFSIAMDDEGWGKDDKERSMTMILDLACINV